MKKNQIYKLLFLVGLAIFCFTNIANAQSKGINVTATVVDEQGVPVSDAIICGPQGLQVTSDENGKFQMTVPGKKAITVEKEGYDTRLLYISDLGDNIVLKKSIFLLSENDKINMGVASKYRRNMVGSVSTINPSEHLTYDNTQRVKDYIDGLLLGVRGANNIRGLGNALFVIDGVFGRNPDYLNMDEVDQITVLKDANAVALYGSQGQNGVIIINTKRGKINDRKANVNVRYGMKEPIALPKYLNSAKYFELYNEALINDAIRTGGTAADATGLTSVEDIENYRTGNKYRYPDVDFYSDEYLRSFTNTADITTEFSGGDEKTQYYVNMGWKYDQSLVKTNPDANVGSNRFNIRGNVDFKVNSWIRSSIDAVAIINNNRSGLADLLKEGATFKPNKYAPMFPVSMIDTVGNPVFAGQLESAKIYNGMLLGSTQEFGVDAPIAQTMAGGYKKSVFRSSQFNNSIDFDLDMITEGLSAKTYLSFDFYDAYTLSVKNNYAVYEPTWTTTTTEDATVESITALTPYGVDLKDLTENVATNSFNSRFAFYGLLNYQKAINENNFINATFLGYLNSQKQNDVIQTDNDAHLGLQVSYDYKKKLFADFSAAYINSIKLPEGERGGFSPTFGLGYVLSEEQFIKNSRFIDYLKLKASGGVIKSDMGIEYVHKVDGKDVTDKYYLYDEAYTSGASFGWADGIYSLGKQVLSQGANPQLGYEERIDLNIGFETLLNKSLWVEFNYFKSDQDRLFTQLKNQYPSYYSAFIPFGNYNKTSYSGFELGMDYVKRINDFSVKVGGNIMYVKSEAKTRDEIYGYDYLYRAGKPANAIFGLVDDGFYSLADFVTDGDGNLVFDEGKAVLKEGLPVPENPVLPGDIKYMDQNDDKIIDDNDERHIGESSNPWSYGVNLKLQYKGLSLFVLGAGQFGGEAMLSNNYYWVDGNDKYSEVVLGRWTEETAGTATYPRLSAKSDNHNYRKSTFWMYNNSFFSIRRAQLTYEFGKDFCQKVRMKNLSISLAGSNLLQFAENKDIRQLNIGSAPDYRYYTVGLRASF